MPDKKVKAFCSAHTNKTIVHGRQKKHHGISYFNCCHTISSALPQNLSEALHTFLLWVARASKNSSTGHSHFHQMAIRWSARSRECRACGQHAQLWRACRKVAAWGYRLPIGWCTATRALTSGEWMSRVMATLQHSSLQMQKFAKTIHVAFALPSLTKN